MTKPVLTLTGPFEKDTEHYLSPGDWYGDPPPPGLSGPWALGFTCWWYSGESNDGERVTFAAETAERALAAAGRWAVDYDYAVDLRAPESGVDLGIALRMHGTQQCEPPGHCWPQGSAHPVGTPCECGRVVLDQAMRDAADG